MCPDAHVFTGKDSRGLVQHLVRVHLGQTLNVETAAQLRQLDKAACIICNSIPSEQYVRRIVRTVDAPHQRDL